MPASADSIQWLSEFWQNHGPWHPSDTQLVAFSVGSIALGLLLAVWGEKMARAMVGLVMVCLGAWLGMWGMGRAGLEQVDWIGLVVGALVMWALASVFYRMWLGILSGVLLAAAGLSIYGSASLAGPIKQYVTDPAARATEQIELPPPPDEVSDPYAAATDELHKMWAYLKSRVPAMDVTVIVIVAAAGGLGLIFGLLAGRAAVVVWTAVLGTVLIFGGALALAARYKPAWFEAAGAHGAATMIAAGVACSASIGLQLFRGRRALAPAAVEASDKSDKTGE